MSLRRHTFANLAGSVLPMALALLTIPSYLRLIGEERYGVLAVIWVVVGYLGFLDFGFGRAVAQRLAKLSNMDGVESSRLLWTAIIMTFGIGVPAGLALWLLGRRAIDFAGMAPGMRMEAASSLEWVAVALPFLLTTTALQGALQARLKFLQLNVIQIVGGSLVQVLPLVVAASGHTQLEQLVPAVLSARMISLALLAYQCTKYVPLCTAPSVDRTHLLHLSSYGGWMSITTMLSPLLVTVDRLVIAAISGPRSVAHYTVPYDLVSRAMVISSSLSSAIFPRMASSRETEAGQLSILATRILVAVMTPIAICGMLAIQPFMAQWVGNSFAGASASVAEIILLGVWLNALAIPHHARLLAADTPKLVVMIYLVQLPIYLTALWMGVSAFGIVGAAAAWTFRVFIDTTLLLKLAGALRTTVNTFLLHACMVGITACVVLSTDADSVVRWTLGSVLFGAAVFKDRRILSKALQTRRMRQP